MCLNLAKFDKPCSDNNDAGIYPDDVGVFDRQDSCVSGAPEMSSISSIHAYLGSAELYQSYFWLTQALDIHVLGISVLG